MAGKIISSELVYLDSLGYLFHNFVFQSGASSDGGIIFGIYGSCGGRLQGVET